MVKLRPYQQEAVDAILSHDKGIISAATGSGKTTMMSQAIAAQPGRALVIVHTKALTTQTAERIRDETRKSVSEFYGDEHGDLDADVVVATWQTLQRQKVAGDHFEHLHVDECHHATGRRYRAVIRRFAVRTIHGYTATFAGPGEQELKRLFGDIIFEISLHDLIETGYLSRMKVYVRADEVGGRGYNEEKFRVVHRVAAANGRQTKALHFYTRKKRFAEIPRWNLLPSGTYAPVSSETSRVDRDRLFADFKRTGSGLSHLVASQVLNEGVDLPIANCLVFHECAGNQRVLTQRFGRGLRRFTNEDDETTIIILFIDHSNYSQMRMIGELVSQIEHDDRHTGRRSIKEWNSHDLPTESEPTNTDGPLTIVLTDRTNEFLEAFRSTSMRSEITADLKETITTLAEMRIFSNKALYRAVRSGAYPDHFPRDPRYFFGFKSQTAFFDLVRDAAGVERVSKPESYASEDEVIATCIKLRLSSGPKYKAAYESGELPAHFPKVPAPFFSCKTKAFYDRIRDQLGTMQLISKTESCTVVDLLVAKGIFGKAAYDRARSAGGLPDSFPSEPWSYFGFGSSAEFWSVVRDKSSGKSTEAA